MLPIVAALCVLTTPQPDPTAVAHLIERCKEAKSWGLVIQKEGRIVLKRNFGNLIPMCNLMSATKSVTSMAIGMLIDQGKIPSVETKVQYFFPEYKGKWKDRVTIQQLLEHTSGIRLYQDDPDSKGGMPDLRVPSALAAPIVTEPGTEFAYNNRGVDLLSGIVRRAAGMPLDEYVNRKLFQPLGIAFFSWARDPDGNPHGCAELALMPTDMAKIGQVMLDGGVWKGKRLISRRYIEEATKPSKITESLGEPCGRLWWICQPNFTFDDDWKEKLSSRFGWPAKVIDKVKPLAGQYWPGQDKMRSDVIQTAGGYRYLRSLGCELEFTWSALLKDVPCEPDEGYFAEGWGGQLILVLPKEKIVAVRTCGSGFFGEDDDGSCEMPDFYRLVRALYPRAATPERSTW